MLGQTVDEAHYVLYGKNLALSYFDHPPLVGWVHGLFQYIPVNELVQARLPAIFISLLTSHLVYQYLLGKNVSQKNTILSVIALNLTPMFNTMSVALLPDTLLMPLVILIIQFTEKILVSSTLRNWLVLGLLLGLSGLSKYTAIVFVPALVLVFVFKSKWRELLNPSLWPGALVAVSVVSPVLIWNLQNDLASFKYQTAHVSTHDSNVFQNIIQSMGLQSVSWGIAPFFLVLTLNGVWLWNIKQLQTKFVSTIYLSVLFVFFAYVSISEVLLPHWMLTYFVVGIPLTVSHLLEKKTWKKTLLASFAMAAVLNFALLFESAFRIFPTEKTAALYEGVLGWDQLINESNLKLNSLPAKKKALAVMNWTLGSRALYYNHNKKDSVFVLDKRSDQFDIWNKNSPAGYDFVVIIEQAKKEEHLALLNCQSLTQIGEKITTIKGVPVNHFLYYHCQQFIDLKN
jgi:4-amino-4-deoxy-L-arabinose transferase-like glycosyltransferase